MIIQENMSTGEKLRILADAAKYDVACTSSGAKRSGVKGRIHSCNFEIADEENAYIHTIEVVLKTVCDLLAKPELQVKNTDFSERKEFYMKNWLRKPI